MKFIDVLKRNAGQSTDIQIVTGETITASSWRVDEDFLVANKQQGFSIYVRFDKIVSCKISD
jgi:hypothetical protein